jgi:hypothetical protein
MKKFFFGVLFLAIIANSAVNQKSIIGNWTLTKQQADPNAIVSLESSTLKITDDWKYEEINTYKVNYPDYGKDKVKLKYELKVTVSGDYRIESDAFRRYLTNFASEILESAETDLGVAQNSLKDIDKMIKDDLRVPAPVLYARDTEMELQGVNNKPNSKYTKPKILPVSKLTGDTIPFFAPEGWRFPDNAKELSSFEVRLKNSKNLLTVVKADFNGDDFIDAAAYLLNSETGQVALFINISQSDGSYELKPYGTADRSPVIENGLMLASAGEHVNSVTKAKVTLDNPGFMDIIFGTTAYLIYWDLSSKDWVKIPVGKKL